MGVPRSEKVQEFHSQQVPVPQQLSAPVYGLGMKPKAPMMKMEMEEEKPV